MMTLSFEPGIKLRHKQPIDRGFTSMKVIDFAVFVRHTQISGPPPVAKYSSVWSGNAKLVIGNSWEDSRVLTPARMRHFPFNG
jgi:hypothetical protein